MTDPLIDLRRDIEDALEHLDNGSEWKATKALWCALEHLRELERVVRGSDESVVKWPEVK